MYNLFEGVAARLRGEVEEKPLAPLVVFDIATCYIMGIGIVIGRSENCNPFISLGFIGEKQPAGHSCGNEHNLN